MNTTAHAPRFRIRLRTLMIVTAVVAILSWAGLRAFPKIRTIWTRSIESREMADFIAANQRIDRKLVAEHEARASAIREQGVADRQDYRQAVDRELAQAEYYRCMAQYHADLERSYRTGAARPWDRLPALPECRCHEPK